MIKLPLTVKLVLWLADRSRMVEQVCDEYYLNFWRTQRMIVNFKIDQARAKRSRKAKTLRKYKSDWRRT